MSTRIFNFALLLPFSCLGQDEYLAFVEVSRGHVAYYSIGSAAPGPVAVSGITFLRAGDRVRLEVGGSAELSQLFARRIALSSGKTYRIDRLPETSDSATLSLIDLIETFRAYGNATSNARRGSSGRVYTKSDLIAIAPRRGLLLVTRPRFHWQGIAKAKSYQLVLRPGLDSDQVLWSADDIATTSMDYPESQPRLEPGRYKWTVSAMDGSGLHISDDTTTFTIPSDSERSALNSKLAHLRQLGVSEEHPTFQYVAFCLGERLYESAIASALRILIQTPDDLDTSKLLMQVYEAADRADLRESLKASLKM